MKTMLSVLLLSVSCIAQAATLTCGTVPCEQAIDETVPWPEIQMVGFPVASGPTIQLELPTGFDELVQHDNNLAFLYPSGTDDRNIISLMSIEIADKAQNGPLGGWKTLYRAQKDGLEVYYYRETRDDFPVYVAAIRNRNYEKRFGKLKYLELTTAGFSEAEFLKILGSLEAVENLMPSR